MLAGNDGRWRRRLERLPGDATEWVVRAVGVVVGCNVNGDSRRCRFGLGMVWWRIVRLRRFIAWLELTIFCFLEFDDEDGGNGRR